MKNMYSWLDFLPSFSVFILKISNSNAWIFN